MNAIRRTLTSATHLDPKANDFVALPLTSSPTGVTTFIEQLNKGTSSGYSSDIWGGESISYADTTIFRRSQFTALNVTAPPLPGFRVFSDV